MSRDFDTPVLPGTGRTDYARYMRTDELLSLQRTESEWVHPDELVFQTVHQATELWLKLASTECARAIASIDLDQAVEAAQLIDRATASLVQATHHLEVMRSMSPWAFQIVRTALGHGSGFESPGWNSLRRECALLWEAFERYLGRHDVDLVDDYVHDRAADSVRLSESMVDLDERHSLWRSNHYTMLMRIIGHGVLGTKGRRSDSLARLVDHRMFPELWRLRTEISARGPLGTGFEQ